MKLSHWLDEAFGSPTRVRVLRHLSKDHRRERTLREIARALNVGPSTVRVALHALLDAGLLDSRRLGRTDGYRLRTSATSNAILHLFDEEKAVEERAREVLRKASSSECSVLLFGSAARGGQTATSDLDLLVVAKTSDKAFEMSDKLQTALATVGSFRPQVIALSQNGARQKRGLPWFQNARREGQLIGGRPLQDWL